MSDTRWGSRVKTVNAFVENLGAVHSALSEMESGTSQSAEKASRLRHSIESFDTVVTSVISSKVLGFIQPLTTQLQTPNIDLMTAYKEAKEVTACIASLRTEEEFRSIYQQAVELAKSIDVIPQKKRVTVRQQYRENAPTQSIEEHYRVNLFYTFIDYLISELETRFSDRTEPALLAHYLVPRHLSKLTKGNEEKLISWYRDDLPQPEVVEQELYRWKHKFQNQNVTESAATVQETLQTTAMEFYPNILCMLTLFLTLPVTTCSCERSFSALRRLKTWLRSSMTAERLTGLAMMHVHRHAKLDPEKILKRWDASGHRRIALAFDHEVGRISTLLQATFCNGDV